MTTTTADRPRNGQRRQHGATSEQIARLFNALPPHDTEAECALLGSMILDPRVIGDVMQVIQSPDDLYKPAHAAIYQVITEVYDKNPMLDLVLIRSELEARGMLEQVGGIEYLIELTESVPSALSWPLYGGVVTDRARKRELARVGASIMESAHGPQDADELIDKAESDVFRVGERKVTTRQDESLGALLQDTYDKLQSDDGMRHGLETGFYELDDKTNGLQPGDLIILAARPSMGKTALSLNMAEHIAIATRRPCVFFSMEMSREQLARRLMCARAGVDSHRLRRNKLDQEDFARLSLTVGEMTDSPLLIDDTPGLSMMHLRAKARRLASRHKIEVVFVDYLQLMTCHGAENRQQEVSALSRGLKQLARELNVPVVCLSQLNRAVENRANNRPKMSDLRESGSIEQDADVVMLLHREDYYHKGESDYVETNESDLIIEKQRNGPTGVVKLFWDGATTRFKNPMHGSSPGGMW